VVAACLAGREVTLASTAGHPVSGRTVVFWDRDGTLMEEVHYCGDPAKVKVYPKVPEALRALKQAGFLNFIVSNQSGIARGLITEAQYHAVQRELLRQIGEDLIDASYFCPDAPDVPSQRRKPQPGMLLEASAEFGIDLSASYMVGDKAADIECGRQVGAGAILVLTGYGLQQTCAPDFTAADAAAAAHWILQR
jgi:D-glycero-D-manno-heptose 1,7-bisphosphate phosphatase